MRGGKRKNAGRKSGVLKFKATFSLNLDLKNRKITSKLVNDLLNKHFEDEQ